MAPVEACQTVGGGNGAERAGSAGAGTKQRAGVKRGEVASVGAAREWGGGEAKQAARRVQGSALGRSDTSGGCQSREGAKRYREGRECRGQGGGTKRVALGADRSEPRAAGAKRSRWSCQGAGMRRSKAGCQVQGGEAKQAAAVREVQGVHWNGTGQEGAGECVRVKRHGWEAAREWGAGEAAQRDC